MESWRGVALSKEHDKGFIEAKGGGEHSLPFISFLDTDVVVPPSDIHFGEILGSFQFVDEGGDEGEWVSILDHVFIEILVILARVKPSIFLLNKEEWGGLWRLRFPDFAGFEMLVDECFTHFPLLQVHRIGFSYLWDEGLF